MPNVATISQPLAGLLLHALILFYCAQYHVCKTKHLFYYSIYFILLHMKSHLKVMLYTSTYCCSCGETVWGSGSAVKNITNCSIWRLSTYLSSSDEQRSEMSWYCYIYHHRHNHCSRVTDDSIFQWRFFSHRRIVSKQRHCHIRQTAGDLITNS